MKKSNVYETKAKWGFIGLIFGIVLTMLWCAANPFVKEVDVPVVAELNFKPVEILDKSGVVFEVLNETTWRFYDNETVFCESWYSKMQNEYCSKVGCV
jgi:hypothetical protein